MNPEQAKSSRPPLYLRKASFVGSFPELRLCPRDGLPVVAITGRSNSGKSSLLSALCDRKNLAKASTMPGKTRTINYFRIDGEGAPFYLVDLPGYGYARLAHTERERLRKLIDEFLIGCETMRLLLVVLDARRNPGAEEKSILAHCQDIGRRFLFVRTKWDRLRSGEQRRLRDKWRAEPGTMALSNRTREGVSELLAELRSVVG